VELAPLYYALAIAAAIQENGGPMTEVELRGSYLVYEHPGFSEDKISLLRRELIFAAALRWLVSRELIKVIEDPFAHDLIVRTEDFWPHWNAAIEDQGTPFYRYEQGGRKTSFIETSLETIDEAYQKLEIKPEDFAAPDVEWSPLKLDPDDADVIALAEKVDEVVQIVRGANEYPSAAPAERSYNLDLLVTFANKLRGDAEINILYARTFFVEPMNIFLTRFAGTARAETLQAAKLAFREVVKKYAKDLFETIIRALNM
jgi:hypothetical protein